MRTSSRSARSRTRSQYPLGVRAGPVPLGHLAVVGQAGAPLRPDKTDPPLAVDPDAPLSPAAAFQGFEPVAGARQVAPAGHRVVRPGREGVGRQSRGLSSRRRVARPIRGGRGDIERHRSRDSDPDGGLGAEETRIHRLPRPLAARPRVAGGRQLRTARPARAPPRRTVPELRRSRQATMPIVCVHWKCSCFCSWQASGIALSSRRRARQSSVGALQSTLGGRPSVPPARPIRSFKPSRPEPTPCATRSCESRT